MFEFVWSDDGVACPRLNPGVPAWVAIPCDLLAAAVLVLLVLDPVGNLTPALVLLAIACVGLYGTAFVHISQPFQNPLRNLLRLESGAMELSVSFRNYQDPPCRLPSPHIMHSLPVAGL